MLACLGLVQCPNAAHVPAQNQGNACWLNLTVRGVTYVCVWFHESATYCHRWDCFIMCD